MQSPSNSSSNNKLAGSERPQPIKRQNITAAAATSAAAYRPTPSAPPDMYNNENPSPSKLAVERPLGRPPIARRPTKSPEKSPERKFRPLAPISPPPPPPQFATKNPHFDGNHRTQNAYDYLDEHDHQHQHPFQEFGKLLSNGRPKSPPQRQENWCQLSQNASIRMVRRGRSFVHTMYAHQNGTMFKVCLVEIALAVSLLGIGILCACEAVQFCPYYSAVWTGLLFLANAVLGLVAAKLDTVNVYLAHLLGSIACILLAVLGAALSAINWQLIGTYKAKHEPGRQLVQPKADERQMYTEFCLLGEHDRQRIHYIGAHARTFDFPACLHRIKIGIAVNSLQFVLTICLGLLFIVSIVYCLLRICTTNNNNNMASRGTKTRT